MYNNNTNILKLIYLDTYDINNEKTECNVKGNEINVTLFLNVRSRVCPHCNSNRLNIHEYVVNPINHPVIAGKKITLYFNRIKFRCKECGRHPSQPNPFADSSISFLGQLFVINQLRNPRKTFSDISKEFFIPETSLYRLFDKLIDIPRHQLTKVICIDEIHAGKLSNYAYALSIYDPLSNTLLDILDNRLKYNFIDYLSNIPISERLRVQYVNIDMYQTYKDVSSQLFPNAKICVDSFHVIKNMNAAIDTIRIQVQKRYADKDNPDMQYYYWLLKNFHYYFKEDFNNIKYERKDNSRYSHLYDKFQVLDTVLAVDDTLKEAYLLKEEYREFNLTATYEEAQIKLPDFIERFKCFKKIEMRDIGRMLERWQEEILNSFIRVDGKRMSNGPMESLNGRLGRIISNGYGYTVFERFRNRAMFALNRNEPIKG